MIGRCFKPRGQLIPKSTKVRPDYTQRRGRRSVCSAGGVLTRLPRPAVCDLRCSLCLTCSSASSWVLASQPSKHTMQDLSLPSGVTWEQSFEDIEIAIDLPCKCVRADVNVTTTALSVEVCIRSDGKGWGTVLMGALRNPVDAACCCWSLEDLLFLLLYLTACQGEP